LVPNQIPNKVDNCGGLDLNLPMNVFSDQISDSISTGGSIWNGPNHKLLVSIGSGVSMIKVSNNGYFERVSGTMIGGGTLVGLSNLLTGINDFD